MPPAIPIATYRLQLTGDFDFDAAAQVAPYLKALGISHVYASPPSSGLNLVWSTTS